MAEARLKVVRARLTPRLGPVSFLSMFCRLQIGLQCHGLSDELQGNMRSEGLVCVSSPEASAKPQPWVASSFDDPFRCAESSCQVSVSCFRLTRGLELVSTFLSCRTGKMLNKETASLSSWYW